MPSKKVTECDVCGEVLGSRRALMEHVRHHMMCQMLAAQEDEASSAETGESSSTVTAVEDGGRLLQWAVKRPRTRMNNNRAVVVVPAREREAAAVRNWYCCNICQRRFDRPRSLSAHKGHHMRQKNKRALMIAAAPAADSTSRVAGNNSRTLVVRDPPPQAPATLQLHQPQPEAQAQGQGQPPPEPRSSRDSSSGPQELDEDRRGSCGRLSAGNGAGPSRFNWDLNKPPPPEGEEWLALLWHRH